MTISISIRSSITTCYNNINMNININMNMTNINIHIKFKINDQQ